jgi:hypothetical protein
MLTNTKNVNTTTTKQQQQQQSTVTRTTGGFTGAHNQMSNTTDRYDKNHVYQVGITV